MEKLVMIYFALTNRIAEIKDNERGATSTEYAMLIAFVVLVIAVAIATFGTTLSGFWDTLGTKVTGLFS